MLSARGAKNVGVFDIPWRYAQQQTYDKETNPNGVISFALAENIPMRREIQKYINDKVTIPEDAIGYTQDPAFTRGFLEALSAHVNRNFSPYALIDPRNIVTASSPTALGGMLGFNLADPGDGILVSRPMYGRFELDYGIEAGVEIVYADTHTEEAFLPSVVDKFEVALQDAQRRGQRIRAVLIANPNNPVGRCYSRETIKAIAGFCQKHQIHLISDEVYAMCVFDSGSPGAEPFTSILAFNFSGLIDPNLVHVLYGFSKDFASGGLRLGFLISQNQVLLQACRAVLRLHGASMVAITIGTAVLQDEEFVAAFTARSRQRLAASYQLTTSILDQEGIKYVKGGNAGFFIYIDLSPFLPSASSISFSLIPVQQQHREFALAQELLDAGIFLHPGEEHGKEPGWFRLVFTQEEDTLVEGLRRMLKVLKQEKGTERM